MSEINWSEVRARTVDMLDKLGIIPIETDITAELEEIVLFCLDKAIVQEKERAYIRLSSNGGKTESGIGIYNGIKLARSHGLTVVGVGTSRVRSAALTLFQACDERLLCKGSTVLVHWGTYTLGNSELHGIMTSDMQWVLQSITDACNRTVEILAERSKLTAEALKDMCWRDEYMSAKKAVELGLADRVVDVSEIGFPRIIGLVEERKSSSKKTR